MAYFTHFFIICFVFNNYFILFKNTFHILCQQANKIRASEMNVFRMCQVIMDVLGTCPVWTCWERAQYGRIGTNQIWTYRKHVRHGRIENVPEMDVMQHCVLSRYCVI